MIYQLRKQKEEFVLLSEDGTQPICSTLKPNGDFKLSKTNCQLIFKTVSEKDKGIHVVRLVYPNGGVKYDEDGCAILVPIKEDEFFPVFEEEKVSLPLEGSLKMNGVIEIALCSTAAERLIKQHACTINLQYKGFEYRIHAEFEQEADSGAIIPIPVQTLANEILWVPKENVSCLWKYLHKSQKNWCLNISISGSADDLTIFFPFEKEAECAELYKRIKLWKNSSEK